MGSTVGTPRGHQEDINGIQHGDPKAKGTRMGCEWDVNGIQHGDTKETSRKPSVGAPWGHLSAVGPTSAPQRPHKAQRGNPGPTGRRQHEVQRAQGRRPATEKLLSGGEAPSGLSGRSL